jgi:hypothetical protein
MLLRSNQMRWMARAGVHAFVIGRKSGSDAEDSGFCDAEARWSVFERRLELRARNELGVICKAIHEAWKICDDNPLHFNRWCGCCELRRVVSPQLFLAAAHRRHVAAIAVHGAAACAFFLSHRTACGAGHDGRCGREQEQDHDECRETTHLCQYRPSIVGDSRGLT